MEGQDSYTVLRTESAPLEVQPFTGLRVLVVEHDHIFAEHLLDLLKGFGADAVG